MTWVLICVGVTIVVIAFLVSRFGAEGKARRGGYALPGRTATGTDVAVSEGKAYSEMHRNISNLGPGM